MKTVIIIQARLGSTRLPRKVLADLWGRPLIDHVVERALAVCGVDSVALNVPLHDYTEIEQAIRNRRRLAVFGIEGQEADVLGRYLKVAEREEADVIVRITGDCPLLAVDLIETAVAAHQAYSRKGRKHCYLPLCMPYMPVADGWDCEVFSMELLRQAHQHASQEQREHVTTWMREPSNSLRLIVPILRQHDWTKLKCSVDTQEDLERVRSIMAWLPNDDDYSHETIWDAWERAGRP